MLRILNTGLFTPIIKPLYLIQLLCTVLFLGASHTTLALDISDSQNSYTLTPHISWFEDKSQLITIDDITQQDTLDRFQRHHKPSFNQGYNDSSHWFYIKLQQQASTSIETMNLNWYLSIEYPQLDRIDIYEKTSDGNMKHHRLGDELPFSQRNIKHRHFIQPLQLGKSDTIELFIKIKSSSTLKLPLYLYNDMGLAEKFNQESASHGVYFGIMAAMLLYNLFMFSALRDKSFIHYMGYILAFSFLQATLIGYSFQYLWPEQPSLNSPLIIILISFSCFFGSTFTREFLSFNGGVVSFRNALNANAIFSLVLAASSILLDYRITIEAALLLILSTCLIIIASAIGNMIKGDYAARFFLLAWLCLLPGAAVYALMSANYIVSSVITENAALLGSALEVILLSLALANRINEMKKRHYIEVNDAQEKLQDAYSKLNQSLIKQEKISRLKDQFLATMSHELRTPMNGVEGALGLIDTRSLNHQQNNYVNAAINSAKKMTSLIDSILNFSEIQAGTVSIKEESIEIRPIFNKLAEQYRSRCKIKDVTLNWHIDKNVPNFIISDRDQLSLVLGQLVDNAIKFTDQGSITVNIFTQQKNTQDQFVLSVNDTGKGICKSKLKSIFNDFQQADADYNRRYGGLGIGLAICHRLSLLMNGKITVESELDSGSHFTFITPLIIPEFLAQPTKAHNNKNIEQKIALIAEDNPVNQMVLKGMLEKLGYFALTSKDGQEALNILDQQPIDIVLMDCQMPGIDGFEATRQIRSSRKAYNNIPIIAVTANAMTSDNARCIAEGMNDYIKKPINYDILESKVSLWLNKSHSPQGEAPLNQT